MNEVRQVLIGFEFNKDRSQICYYDRTLNEPVSVAARPGTSEYAFPTMLCFREEQRDWVFGLEAEEAGNRPGGIPVRDLYERVCNGETTRIGRMEIAPEQLLSIYLQLAFGLLGLTDLVKSVAGVMFTSRAVRPELVRTILAAMQDLGFAAEQVAVIDEEESFYYYTFSQKKDVWARRVGLFSFQDNQVSARILTKDIKLRPVVVSLIRLTETTLPDLPEEKDNAFLSYAQSALEDGGYSSVFVTGEAFSMDWAERSVKYLCRVSQHVYAGDNLYVKGACYALLDRYEHQIGAGHLFLGAHRLAMNVGMEMLVSGNSTYVPLINAGTNWYEAGKECELLLEGEPALTFLFRPLSGGEEQKVRMEMNGLPVRPDGTTRLRLQCRCTSEREVEFTVTDLGFGDFYPKSGMVFQKRMEL